MDIKLFQQKLNDICAIAEENNKQLSQQQIRDHFDESDLSTSQLVKILQYLKLKGITIEGTDEGTGADRADAVSSESQDKEELPGTRAALTAEEQAYLSVRNSSSVSVLLWRESVLIRSIRSISRPRDLIRTILLPSFRPLQRETLLPKVH